jgi:ABC-2 type transport system permease protein
MQLYLALIRISFQRQLTYRAATIAGLLTNFFFGLVRAALMVALYGAQTVVTGLTINDAITFTGLSQALIAFLSLFSWYEVMDSVYSGDVASDLLKPTDYYLFWLAQDCGRATAQLLLRGLPIMFIYSLVYSITFPRQPLEWLWLGLALLLSWLVSFSWRFLVNLASFWTPNAVGIGRFTFFACMLLSGFLMPLRFFPDWFQRLAAFTPFPHTVNTLVEVYLGVLKGPQLLAAFLNQLIWLVLLISAGQLVIQGG